MRKATKLVLILIFLTISFLGCTKQTKHVEPIEFKETFIFIPCKEPVPPVLNDFSYNTDEEYIDIVKARYGILKLYIKDLLAEIECYKVQTKK